MGLRGLRNVWVISAAAAVLAACGDGSLAPEPEARFAISDGAHAGNEHFYFLPSLVEAPQTVGTFDGSLSPEVHICAWDGTSCSVTLAMFNMDAGFGSETVKVDESEEHYVVTWHAREALESYEPGPGEVIRVRVLVDGHELGFVDLSVSRRGKKKLRAANGDQVVPFNGRSLPIKFRIEEGAMAGADEAEPIVGVSTGRTHSCAVGRDGLAYCWGANHRGQLGTGVAGGTYDTPQPVAGGLTWQTVEASQVYTCGLATDARVYCWGSNTLGELGIGTADFDPHPLPEPVAGGMTFASLASLGDNNSSSTCAVTEGGDMYCWGLNDAGQLGTGTVTYTETTPAIVAGGLEFAGPAGLARRYACGLTTSAETYCWGVNEFGQLGRGFVSPFSSPEPSPGLVSGGHAFEDITVGAMHACGIDAAGAAWCWGRNDDGELGLGTRGGSQSVPREVTGGHGFTRLSAGWVFTCGVDDAGDGLCWGVNQTGQLGRGFAGGADQPTPGLVVGGHAWTSIRAGWQHACGVTPTGEVWCWGRGSNGQLGQGSTTGTSSPVFAIDLDPTASP